jgi:hypothetical protein
MRRAAPSQNPLRKKFGRRPYYTLGRLGAKITPIGDAPLSPRGVGCVIPTRGKGYWEDPAMGASGADGERRLRLLTGVLLILTPVAFNVFFTLLSVTFEYPDILREPSGHVLRRFDAGGSSLIALWYGFMLTAVLFVPLAVAVHKILARQDTPYMAVATAFGVVAGVVQFLGLVRWPFLVPYLADAYLDPASSGATRESVAVVFQAFNQYAGVGVGENLGYLFTGLWTLLVALAMLASPLPLGRWLALLGALSAAGILVGMLEPVGFEPAANIVVAGYIAWSVWLLAFGLLLLISGSFGDRGASGSDPATPIENLAGSHRGDR